MMGEADLRPPFPHCLTGNTVRTKTLMACMELGTTLSRKVNLNAFLFKASKGS
jgi:hypothetical protein